MHISLLGERTVILLYHRVASHRPDPQLLCVSPERFMEHMEVLTGRYRVRPLRDLARRVGQGRPFGRSVIITFDDGYADNYWNAKPVLERFGVPATTFVTAGYVDADRELPSDILERCLLGHARLPGRLELTVAGKAHAWDIDALPEEAGSWNVTVKSDPSLRHTCYRELHRLLRPLGEEERAGVLDQLALWASCVQPREDRRVMSSMEIKLWASTGLLDVGSHSEHHLLLASQPVEVQEREMRASRERLASILERRVTNFSYPYGGRADVGTAGLHLARNAGYSLACANEPGLATLCSNRYWLPRHLVRDWDGDEFAQRLDGAFHGRSYGQPRSGLVTLR